ncbi:MAG: hypothetical protein WBW14_12220 [Candidatus Acidiferrum sp.]
MKEKLALHTAAELRQKAREWLTKSAVNHRQLAQHQHYAEQLPPSRDVRVGVGVLGRWRLHRRQRRRPDASVEVHGEPNTDAYSYSDSETYSDTETSPNSGAAPVARLYILGIDR